MFFARMRVSAYAGLFSKWLRKKQFIGFSFKFLYFYYPKECVLFEKRLCFKPKYIHFVYSFVAYVTFSSSCLCRLDQFVVFFSTRSTRTCRCHGKWYFLGSSVLLVVKNTYDLRSQIRFWILPKKRTLKLSTNRGCITSALQATTTLGWILLKACFFKD